MKANGVTGAVANRRKMMRVVSVIMSCFILITLFLLRSPTAKAVDLGLSGAVPEANAPQPETARLVPGANGATSGQEAFAPAQRESSYLVNQGKCLDIEGAHLGNGEAKIELYHCHGSSNRWIFNDTGYTTIRLSNRLDKCLAVSSEDQRVVLWKCNGHTNQKWTFDSHGRIHNVKYGKCLDVNGHDGNRDGAQVLIYACGNGDNQRWGAPVTYPEAPLVKQCIWNKAGFTLDIDWIHDGQVVRTNQIMSGQGNCNSRGDTGYQVSLSIAGSSPKYTFYTDTPSTERYLDVWGTIWSPQTGPGGPIN